jgi:hypothetical protein
MCAQGVAQGSAQGVHRDVYLAQGGAQGVHRECTGSPVHSLCTSLCTRCTLCSPCAVHVHPMHFCHEHKMSLIVQMV